MSKEKQTTQEQPLLTVQDLVKTFGAIRAVDSLSFTLQQGQTVSIIGPNGSGKTSALNLISGVLRPNSGQILFAGKAIQRWRPEQIAEQGIARTFQNGRVFGNMSVRENVLVGMHSHLQAARPLARWRHIPVLLGITPGRNMDGPAAPSRCTA
jgi:branched-chain amino acid transport system ATP-binding protein